MPSAIHALIDDWAQRGEMLERPLGEIHEAIRDFKVARDGGEVVGCGSLHIMGTDIAEIRSLAVREDQHGKGVGAAIVQACVAEGLEMGIERVFALTYQAGVLRAAGFRPRKRDGLPAEGLERVRALPLLHGLPGDRGRTGPSGRGRKHPGTEVMVAKQYLCPVV